jgi:hypothetical protein
LRQCRTLRTGVFGECGTAFRRQIDEANVVGAAGTDATPDGEALIVEGVVRPGFEVIEGVGGVGRESYSAKNSYVSQWRKAAERTGRMI